MGKHSMLYTFQHFWSTLHLSDFIEFIEQNPPVNWCQNLTLRKIAIWLSKNFQKLDIFFKKRIAKFLAIFWKSNGNFPEGQVLSSTDDQNAQNLSDMENCLFLLCLDRPTLPSGTEDVSQDMTAMTHHILHGQGVEHNSPNRWMDKTIQVDHNPNPNPIAQISLE